MILQGCAGPGGWCTGLRMAGNTEFSVGVEWDHAACLTAVAAGHVRVQADIATFPLAHLRGKVTGLIMSPPCPTWSMAGDGAGKVDMPNVYRLIADFANERTPGDYEWADERSRLTAEPMRWATATRPRWIALEQVPPVLPLWRYTAELLRKQGYRTWTGVLSAEEFGVPQTRKRAILMASLDGPVGPPVPTHQAYRAGRDIQVEPDLFGDPLPPPVSMAKALGREVSAQQVQLVSAARTKVQDGTLPRSTEHPAMTVAFGHADMRWLAPAGATSEAVDPRPDSDPSHAITGTDTATWLLRNGTQDNACTRALDEPAGTVFFGQRGNAVDWVMDRPATSVLGDARIAPPGHRDRKGGERQFGADTVRVTVQEAGILQSFPGDYPWRGTKTAQYRQVGDAVCPLLAMHILRPLLALSATSEREVAA